MARAAARISGHVELIKRKRGPQFYVKYRLADGRQRMKRLGPAWSERGRPPVGYFTRKMAEEALQAILTDARRGQLADAITTGATFADAAAEWLRYVEHDRKRRHSTIEDYRNVVRSNLLPEFGEASLEGITTEWIDGYRARLVAEGRLSDRTINKLLVLLHGIFKRAQRVWGLPGNPVTAVERQPVPRSGDFDVLSPGEVAALERAAESEQDAALFVVAAFTGLRMGELLALRWGDVDFGKRLVHVRRSYTHRTLGPTKSGRVRSVPLIDDLVRVLDGLSRREHFTSTEDLVFVNTVGNALDDSKLRRRFYRALERAGLKRIRFHDLRHSFGTLAVQVFPLSDVMAYMGHADIQTTMVYVHHVPADDAAERLSRAVARSGDFVGRDPISPNGADPVATARS
ncbi:MAG TPA: tyrosine-type recombinase/integrase [Tepidiformaceae bacterium]|nr:tyrosine-type recombinase/integrase [Tepidiformaceae bacterium]